MYNNAVICGRLVNDLVLKTNVQNQKYCVFTIAVNNYYSKITNFIPCIASNKTAENMVKFLKKGALILVEGSLRSQTFKDNSPTSRLNYLTISANNVVFLETKKLQTQKTTENNEKIPTTTSIDNENKTPVTKDEFDTKPITNNDLIDEESLENEGKIDWE